MNLAIVSGRRPAVLTDIDRLKPLVRDHDVVAFGFRDAEQSRQYGSRASEYLRYTPASLTKYVSWELPLPPNKRSESCSGTTLTGSGSTWMPRLE